MMEINVKLQLSAGQAELHGSADGNSQPEGLG
jgi:hypothetical protein